MYSLTVELNNIKYLSVDILITERNKEKVCADVKNAKGLYQGIKEVYPGSFMQKPHIVFQVLIPETEVENYCQVDRL